MKKLVVGVAVLVFMTFVPATAEIIDGTVTGGSAFTVGGIFVKLTVPLSNPFGPPNSVGTVAPVREIFSGLYFHTKRHPAPMVRFRYESAFDPGTGSWTVP
jgi:hypothetical protein